MDDNSSQSSFSDSIDAKNDLNKEIDFLSKKYSRNFQKSIVEGLNEISLQFIPSDPDYPYENIRIFTLRILFPLHYPKIRPILKSINCNILPDLIPILEDHINKLLQSIPEQPYFCRKLFYQLDRNILNIIQNTLNQNNNINNNNANIWTIDQQILLDSALLKYINSTDLDIVTKWHKIQEMVPNKTVEDCLLRYLDIQKTLKELSWKMNNNNNNNNISYKESPNYLLNINGYHKPVGTGILLTNLEKLGISVFIFKEISVSCKCDKCNVTIKLNLVENVMTESTCSHCNALFKIIFYPIFAGNNSSNDILIGYIHAYNLSPLINLITNQSKVILVCSVCSFQSILTLTKPYYQQNCENCNSLIQFSYSSSSNSVVTIHSFHNDSKINNIDSIIQGRRLPDTGICEHNTLSFKWFIYPCCKNFYPCDQCHNINNNHIPNDPVNFICGFCSAIQPILYKICRSCGNNINGSTRSGYWEGGTGCRDQVTMKRSEKKKYANINKTKSKKKQQKDDSINNNNNS